MSRIVGKVRRSQLITTYGVGAVVAVADESVMVAGLDRWVVDKPDLHEPRLEERLHVQGFVSPPASGDAGHRDVPCVRFPLIYSCPSCRRIDRHAYFCQPGSNKCNQCGVPLVPSRFVVACDRGHIDDFPYFEWVHAGTPAGEGTKHVLAIDAAGMSAALGDITISCSCGKASTMQGAFGRDALKGVRSCTGRRPWLEDNEECSQVPRTLQRGASNVYFAVTESALSIPPWSEGALKVINRYWTVLKNVPDSALEETIRGMGVADGTAYKPEDLATAVKQRKEGGQSTGQSTGLRAQEYEALVVGKEESSRDQDFVCLPVETVDACLDEWIDQAMAVKRLREVRAVHSFTRLAPPSPSDPPERLSALSRSAMTWLPGMEVTGEGVFLRLDESRLSAWEASVPVVTRARVLDDRYAARFAARGAAPDRHVTPRLVLVHTLAHALINQWSMESGYPASSLRERLYVGVDDAGRPMAGLLVYTATSDSAGSLGGLVSQAEGPRLGASVREAVWRASWCSADPLCVEADAAGADSLNLAACHACVLLPEVSCEESNVLLDRAFLVGTPDMPQLGFFADMAFER